MGEMKRWLKRTDYAAKPSQAQREYFDNDRPLWVQWLACEITDSELLDNVHDRAHYVQRVGAAKAKRGTEKRRKGGEVY